MFEKVFSFTKTFM